jgi:hypothetical protein
VVVGNAAFENPENLREIGGVLNKINTLQVSMS